ncbi:MAG: DUF4364 family protein [Bacteroidales bacterium]|nr:DUF4364 family protein [Bacteroidales bacterium]MCM1415253.1 DUF4364 family protein [bacterium]MCM1423277.1 DUF4364 family protein [bacterium]
MKQDPLTLYKLITLYMLDRVTFPLTKAQIGDFLLGHDYTNFLTLQQVIAELIDAELIRAASRRNRTYLEITSEGKSTLSYFENRIGDPVKEDIAAFFAEHEMEMRSESSIMADYDKSTSGEYEARLLIKEKDVTMVNLTLSVPDEDTAAAICANWQQKCQNIYQYLVSQLF